MDGEFLPPLSCLCKKVSDIAKISYKPVSISATSVCKCMSVVHLRYC